ncbi:hypothetical protein IDJ77_22630 [Mucilaginibacter sp. ZT4R22]|uniref:Uncharacterized protein n=1 Tax=Mucilaginibacter pankratovii TaxID=2772110 RepID=A0ABR7WWF7_9SPHI|nr:hypothetical protein [Mucilaginibacter pankratovii]MBD1366625.1 hypothetical protein [Mucilaginibacter pankratovii]
MFKKPFLPWVCTMVCLIIVYSFYYPRTDRRDTKNTPTVKLTPVKRFVFKSFVDCNMSEVWVGTRFTIFPGKYGEDPVWGPSNNLKYASGKTVDEVISTPESGFTEPKLPPNVEPGKPGLHGAIWFESIYQDAGDRSGKTLYALYHNENYPATLPYDAKTGKGYKNHKWPEGLRGAETASAVCRIGIMRSADDGKSWVNRGIFIEDEQPRMILKPNNTAINFAGGTGDPSAIANGNYLYLFYGEYGYPGAFDEKNYNPKTEWQGQCISIARILISDLNHPEGKAKRWDGKGFNAPYNGVGKPVASLQIPQAEGGGPTSSPTAKYYWGPSVSWNVYLKCWVMTMAKAEGPSWKGSSVYVSFNKNRDLGIGNNSQEWGKPQLLANKPGHTLWYPSLQPLSSEANSVNKLSSVRSSRFARLFYKDNDNDKNDYVSEYLMEFVR